MGYVKVCDHCNLEIETAKPGAIAITGMFVYGAGDRSQSLDFCCALCAAEYFKHLAAGESTKKRGLFG